MFTLLAHVDVVRRKVGIEVDPSSCGWNRVILLIHHRVITLYRIHHIQSNGTGTDTFSQMVQVRTFSTSNDPHHDQIRIQVLRTEELRSFLLRTQTDVLTS